MLHTYGEVVFESVATSARMTNGTALKRKHPVKRLFISVCECKGMGWRFSRLAGKFLQIRKRGGRILVLQLNTLLLEKSVETRLGETGYTTCFSDIIAGLGHEIMEVLLLGI